MLTMDIRRTPIGLWARLRDSHKSGPQSGGSLAWTLAQRNDWSDEPSIFVDGDLAESIKRSASDRLGDLVP